MNDSIELQSGLTRFAIGEQLATTDSGEMEILRVYAVELTVPGTDITFGIEVPLRYDEAGAKRRDQDSPEAHAEAFRRACVIKRKSDPTSANTIFARGTLTWLRSSLRPARRKG